MIVTQWFRRILILCACTVSVMACVDHDIVVHVPIKEPLLTAVNAVRTSGCNCGSEYMSPVPPLIWNDTLARAAEDHAKDMYDHHYFSHLSQDGTPPIVRVQELGYTGNYVGENIARGYSNVESVMKGWLESEEHCRAIMDSTYNEMGAYEERDYWVLDFGRSN
jgi:uncharacterized protein YkwD